MYVHLCHVLVTSDGRQTRNNDNPVNVMHSIISKAGTRTHVKWDVSGEREQVCPAALPDATNDSYG